MHSFAVKQLCVTAGECRLSDSGANTLWPRPLSTCERGLPDGVCQSNQMGLDQARLPESSIIVTRKYEPANLRRGSLQLVMPSP